MAARPSALRSDSGAKSPFHAAAAAAAARSHALAAVGAAALLLGCIGGFVFHRLERDAELQRYALNSAIYTSLVESVDFEYCHDIAFKNVGYCKQHAELESRLRAFFDRAGNSVTDLRLWTWLGSFFFVFNLSSTVGYATQGAPATPGGQLAAVVFGLAGVPLFGCALVLSSGPLASAASAVLRGCRPTAINAGLRPRTVQAIAGALLAGALWFGAAVLFKLVEGWSYSRALFFCFMTISTVGIGTDVPSTAVGRALCMAYIFLAVSASYGLLRAAERKWGQESTLAAALKHDAGGDERQARARRRVLLASGATMLVLCVGGGVLFPLFERDAEIARYDKSRTLYADLAALGKYEGCHKKVLRNMDFCRNVNWFREHLITFFGPDTVNSMVDRSHWTGAGSFAFALSVASTIGYGAQTPHTREGKVATVIFASLAIPAFACCAFICASYLRAVARRWSEKVAVSARDLTPHGASGVEGPLIGPLGDLTILVLFLWLAGAVAFCAIEGWGFAQSLYFCFVTLSAVGYANVTPQTLLGRVVMLAYIGVGLASAASLASEVVNRIIAALGVDDEDSDEEDDERGLLCAPPAAPSPPPPPAGPAPAAAAAAGGDGGG